MNGKTMKAYAAFSPDQIREVLIPIPEIDDYEVLVKNEGCVFCNTTDRMIAEHLFATPDYPTILGHEDFGTVVKVGKKVKKYKTGDRVICANAIVNGYNGEYYSTWGGFAQYGVAGDLEAYLNDGGVLDEKNSYRERYGANSIIPNDLPYDKAALVFSMAETASALLQVGDLTGKTVVVIGTGFVGYSFIVFAKSYGAKNVICLGRREQRLETARNLGADKGFIDVDEAAEYIKSIGGADVVLEASGNYRCVEKGLPYLKENGIFAIYAVPHIPYSFDLQNTPVSFTCRRISPDVEKALEKVCDLLYKDAFPYEVFLTHQWEWEEMPKGYEEVKKGNVIKGIVRIPQ